MAIKWRIFLSIVEIFLVSNEKIGIVGSLLTLAWVEVVVCRCRFSWGERGVASSQLSCRMHSQHETDEKDESLSR